MLRLFLMLGLLAGMPALAWGQASFPPGVATGNDPTQKVPMVAPGCVTGAGSDLPAGRAVLCGTHGTTGAPVSDIQSAAFTGELSMTVGQIYAAGRSLKVICTTAGTVSVTYVNGSTGTWPVVVGTQILPLAVTQVNSSGTTAAATYANLL